MNRREALVTLTTLFGGTIFGAQRLLAGAVNTATAGRMLSAAHLALLDEVAEAILPTTPGSPGAKAAGLAAFMQEIVRDYYSEREYGVFAAGPGQIDVASRDRFGGRDFMSLKPEERFELLMSFEKASPVPEYYRMIKQLTVWGYFTSEIGMTQALRHIPVPERYEGCVRVGPDAKAWAE